MHHQNLYERTQSTLQKSFPNLRKDYIVSGDYFPHFMHFHIFTWTLTIFFVYQFNNLKIFSFVTLLIKLSYLDPKILEISS